MVGAMIVLLIVFVVGIVALVSAQRASLERHQQQMLAWAQSAGWQYTPRMPELVRRWRGDPFAGGLGARAIDVVMGRTPGGRPFVSFEYQYEVSTGRSTVTVEYWIIALRLPAVLPELRLTRENVGTRLIEAFGGQDITLESEDFNKAYRVQAADQAAAYGVLHPRMMEWLLGEGRALPPWRITDGDLLAYRAGRPRYEELPLRLALLDRLVDEVPRYIWSDYGRGALPRPT